MSDLQPGLVTVADLYRELVGMRGDLAKATTKLEVIDAKNTTADAIHADHESRLRAIESWRWKVTGAAIALGTASGVISGLLTGHVH